MNWLSFPVLTGDTVATRQGNRETVSPALDDSHSFGRSVLQGNVYAITILSPRRRKIRVSPNNFAVTSFSLNLVRGQQATLTAR